MRHTEVAVENRVVAHYLDGRMVKGVSMDVSPTKPACHVTTAEGEIVRVALTELKALFFVRDLTGDPERREVQAVEPSDPRARGAKMLEIRFRDGEVMVTLSSGYSDERPFFFVYPADPDSNSTRILVNRAAVLSVK